MDQLSMPTIDAITMTDSSKLGIAFRKFHKENPWVYQELVKLTFKLLGKGRKRYGMKGLFEVIRWHRAMETDADDGFKLNNNHTAFYARMLMMNELRLKGFFVTRDSKADKGARHGNN